MVESVINSILFIIAISATTRAGGKYSGFHFLTGAFIGYWIHPELISSIIMAIAYWGGSTPAFGEVIGSTLGNKKMAKADLESWQYGILGENKLLALITRGFMWAILPGIVAYYTSGYVIAAFLFASITIGFASAPYIVKRFIKLENEIEVFPHLWKEEVDKMWAVSQWVQGAVVGLILTVGTAW